ncbi:hypothetical protein D9758_009083 [Tetrapyrgos nigripes]|uniref:Serine aminopeptidase S33 domain-containing protein n=1 Tax=Tetrapyrgos nigripes TaxID=182062 RepID=A0A8H5GA01_9AGAR|nr:hypothetical protein D9758_009083 [Tetrapyrgos nigripes]
MPGTLSSFSRLVRHGQILCIYPAAFEDEEERIANYSIPDDLLYEEVTLTTSDGIELKCFLLRTVAKQKTRAKSGGSAEVPSGSQSGVSQTSGPRATVIAFHGNGYHVWHHAYSGQNFVKMGCDILLVSYRGYGNSKGRPSEKGLRRDAQAALEYVLADPELSKSPIILHGHSLGGAVAVALIARNPSKIAGLILENTFLSIPLVVKDLPVLRHLTPFIHQTWESRKRILKVPRTTPIMIIAGKKDLVVPETHSRGLWRISRRRGLDIERPKRTSFACGGKQELDEDKPTRTESRDEERKKESEGEDGNPEDLQNDMYLCIPNGTHADTWTSPDYWVAVERFISSIERNVVDLSDLITVSPNIWATLRVSVSQLISPSRSHRQERAYCSQANYET